MGGLPTTGFTPKECEAWVDELVRKCINAKKSPFNRIVSEQAGRREDAGDELAKDQGFSNLDRFKRRIGEIDRPLVLVRDRRSSGPRHLIVKGFKEYDGLDLGAYHSGLFV